jgi:hypothetical protein
MRMKESHEIPYLAVRGEQGWCKRGSRPCTLTLSVFFVFMNFRRIMKNWPGWSIDVAILFLPINIWPSATTYYTLIMLHSVGSSMHTIYHEAPT